jgi:Protein of unknown function (DUF3593)/Protein of unknown function (DUF2499)
MAGYNGCATLILVFTAFAAKTTGFNVVLSSWNRQTSVIFENKFTLDTRTQHSLSGSALKLISLDSLTDSTNQLSAIACTYQTLVTQCLSMNKDTAEAFAGPFFGLSLFPYLAFIYFLNVKENEFPKGVTVGFASCLLFVVLTIPAAIAAKVLYNESLANCDWLHGSAESMLTITNLATVIPFRQALQAKCNGRPLPMSATNYGPTLWLVGGMTTFAVATAIIPALSNPSVHTPYLNGFMDVPFTMERFGANFEPDNSLTVATWIIHVSSLVEFLVAMGFCWRWADIVNNPTWKGLTWGLLPLHSSGITACVSHLFYNQIAILVPLQAVLTCIGNTTAAYAAFRIAVSNGWKPNFPMLPTTMESNLSRFGNKLAIETPDDSRKIGELQSLIGFEDLGDTLANDNNIVFVAKLFVGCSMFSYLIKYGETFFDFPYDASIPLSLIIILIPSALNAFKWNRRSQDSTFEGWF